MPLPPDPRDKPVEPPRKEPPKPLDDPRRQPIVPPDEDDPPIIDPLPPLPGGEPPPMQV